MLPLAQEQHPKSKIKLRGHCKTNPTMAPKRPSPKSHFIALGNNRANCGKNKTSSNPTASQSINNHAPR